ncbi:MAG: RNA polymerase sigma factor [Bacteroidales bacterium]|nr:RNA polymerase sigma factor [Bacteroidales bacterium]
MIFSQRQGSIENLVQGCLNNNRHAQKKLFDLYKDAMYTVVYRILRNEPLAADALQEGFIQVFSGIGNFRFEATLGSWIKTIMVRSALKILRNEPLFDTHEPEVNQVAIEWDTNLTGEMLDKAIACLSNGYRTVFLLIEVEGYSHAEVAEMLGISPGTSKSQLSRAKAILQQTLKDFMNS